MSGNFLLRKFGEGGIIRGGENLPGVDLFLNLILEGFNLIAALEGFNLTSPL